MDFGLARTLEGDGMTQTGALVGTMDYMSPEQALGKDLDQRSDVFALGLIFYELLTGKMPYKADSAVASLLKRTQERAAPVSSHDATIPKPLSNIVGKCMEPDVKLRYQNSAEILADLEAWQGGRAAATLNFPTSSKPWGQTIPWHWIGEAAALVAWRLSAIMLREKIYAKCDAVRPAANKSISVLVADFTNHTGDPIFDDTLEPMFNVALEGASFINAYNRGTAHNLAKKLPHPSDKLDEQSARLIGVSQGLAAVVTGSLSLRGDGLQAFGGSPRRQDRQQHRNCGNQCGHERRSSCSTFPSWQLLSVRRWVTPRRWRRSWRRLRTVHRRISGSRAPVQHRHATTVRGQNRGRFSEFFQGG